MCRLHIAYIIISSWDFMYAIFEGRISLLAHTRNSVVIIYAVTNTFSIIRTVLNSIFIATQHRSAANFIDEKFFTLARKQLRKSNATVEFNCQYLVAGWERGGGVSLICNRIIISNADARWFTLGLIYRVYLRTANCVPCLVLGLHPYANGGLITCSPIDRMSTGRALVNSDDESHRSCTKRRVK